MLLFGTEDRCMLHFDVTRVTRQVKVTSSITNPFFISFLTYKSLMSDLCLMGQIKALST